MHPPFQERRIWQKRRFSPKHRFSKRRFCQNGHFQMVLVVWWVDCNDFLCTLSAICELVNGIIFKVLIVKIVTKKTFLFHNEHILSSTNPHTSPISSNIGNVVLYHISNIFLSQIRYKYVYIPNVKITFAPILLVS